MTDSDADHIFVYTADGLTDIDRSPLFDIAFRFDFTASCVKSFVKLVLLDEADAMTKDAQFALRRVIEKHTKSTRFALICNHVNKIIPALQSRCTRFRFAPLDPAHIRERLQYVINTEGYDRASFVLGL